ncbi:hypothetical protein ACFXJ8_31205 [Nonomuraea sp. NPDC059194]|uniref:hypothetical protein n=1 Tax=Nonomuraea sp. NPDC059194 TaxID=3346764 RepID=UPI0036957656
MARSAAVTVTLAAALSGCGMMPAQFGGGGGEEKQQQSQPIAAESSAAPQQAESAPPEQQTESAPPEQQAQSAPAEQQTTIASREVKAGGADLLVSITSLKRQGKLATLAWTVTNQGESRWDMGTDMGDTPAGLGLTVGGVNLVDPVNGKRYKVARTGQYPRATCLCSDYDVFTEPGEVLPLHATFAAPPADVTKINVDLRVLGVFTDVPVS